MVCGAPVLTRIRADKRLVDSWLRRALELGNGVPLQLGRAMRYAVFGPGKRIRPILTLEAFRAAGGRGTEWVRPFCCGIEMIHAFSLVHDDLPSLDDDDLRRGRPSLHRRFDEGTAILAADALLVKAFELFATSPAPARRRLAAIGTIARAIGPAGMAGGQAMDLEGLVRRGRQFRTMQLKKTAEFLAAALLCGAQLAGAGKRIERSLARAGRLLGELFQTTDDLIDAAGDRDKATAVSLYGRDKARQEAGRQAELARAAFLRLGPGYSLLAQFPGLLLERTS